MPLRPPRDAGIAQVDETDTLTTRPSLTSRHGMRRTFSKPMPFLRKRCGEGPPLRRSACHTGAARDDTFENCAIGHEQAIDVRHGRKPAARVDRDGGRMRQCERRLHVDACQHAVTSMSV